MRLFASLFLIPAVALSALTATAAAPAIAPPAGAPPAASRNQPVSLYDLMGVKPPGLRGAELEAAVAGAAAFPLGSAKNPVRTSGIAGQRAYLARLRCADGKRPRVLGRSISMPSPFGGVGDTYAVACGAVRHSIEMDMYHDHVEFRPVPGFTIAAR